MFNTQEIMALKSFLKIFYSFIDLIVLQQDNTMTLFHLYHAPWTNFEKSFCPTRSCFCCVQDVKVNGICSQFPPFNPPINRHTHTHRHTLPLTFAICHLPPFAKGQSSASFKNDYKAWQVSKMNTFYSYDVCLSVWHTCI